MNQELANAPSIQRRVRMLDIFRDARRTTADALAKELGCNIRTVYRDIAELKAYGLPIEGQAGAGCGYLWRGNSL